MKNRRIQEFSEAYGLTQVDKGLLRQAFTHSSADKKNNERLEFLGDAVLDSIISEKLYRSLPDAKEHYLTRLRAHLVNKHALAALADDLNFSEMVILGQGERQTGGRRRASILADALEAVIGAVFISSGYKQAEDFVLAIYRESLQDLPEEISLKDPKTRLQEWLQQRGHAVPDYRIIDEVGKPHAKTFTVEIMVIINDKHSVASEYRLSATGKSRRAAEQQVAEDLMLQLIASH